MRNIQTMSIVAGSSACNARCPFCVSRMTGLELELQEPSVSWRNFSKACQLAALNGVATVLITGKGEPTLFPDQITSYLEAIQEAKEFNPPFIELQTNASKIADGTLTRDRPEAWHGSYLKEWRERGLTTIAISLVHLKPERNKEIYGLQGFEAGHFVVPDVVRTLKELGFTVRLTVMLVNGFIDTPEKVTDLISLVRTIGADQLTIRPIRRPNRTEDREVSDWTWENGLRGPDEMAIRKRIENMGTKLMSLAHGATIYDIGGQNVCLSDCLTIRPDEETRQIIFFPDGSLRYDWQYKGAVLLGPDKDPDSWLEV